VQRWRDKRGRAALRDWRTWAFLGVIVIVSAAAESARQSAGWGAFAIVWVVALAVEVAVVLLVRRRRKRAALDL
jgi:hypothetical protein